MANEALTNDRHQNPNLYVVAEEDEYFVIELPPIVERKSEGSTQDLSSAASFLMEETKEVWSPNDVGVLASPCVCMAGHTWGLPSTEKPRRWSSPRRGRADMAVMHGAAFVQCIQGAGVFAFALLPIVDMCLDAVVTAGWYAKGNRICFRLSLGIFAWFAAVVAIFCWGTTPMVGCCPFSQLWQLCFANRVAWDESSVARTALTFAVLGELACEATPQVALQTYAFVDTYYNTLDKPGSHCKLLATSVAIGVATIAGGLVNVFLGWESASVRTCAAGFLASMILARCGALAAVASELNGMALVFAVLCLATRAFLLDRFAVVNFTKNLSSIPASPSEIHRRVTEEEFMWTQWMRSVGSVTSRFHAIVHDLVCLTPWLLVLSLVPFGARVDPALNDDGHRFEGIKRLTAFGGAAVNTFRNRLSSDFAIVTILFHLGENVLMILATAVATFCRPNRQRRVNTLELCSLTFVLLATAALFYFTAASLVKRREDRWLADLAVAKTSVVDDAGCKQCFLTGEINRPGSLWHGVFVKQQRVGRAQVLCHLPDLVTFCCKNYRGPQHDYAFDSIDGLMADLDYGAWNDSRLTKFRDLGLHGLTVGRVDDDELDGVEALVTRAIRADNVRPKLRAALDHLAFEIEDSLVHMYSLGTPASAASLG